MKKIYILCTIIIIIGIAAGIGYFLYRDASAKIPEDITLVTMHGDKYKFADSDKKIKVLEFMYGHCPDICPTTTTKLTSLKKELQKAGVYGDKVQFLSVTIDPYRDTPEELIKYMKKFSVEDDGNWIFLTGDKNNIKKSQEDIQRLANTFKFQYRDPGDGFYIHTNFLFLIDENNKFIKKYPMGKDFDQKDMYNRIMKEIK